MKVPSTSRKSESQIAAAGRTGPSRPLEPQVRAPMEARFGHDFRHVRVFTGGEASRAATRLNARAYTERADIVFRDQRYDSELLAHELAHVVQHDNASRGTVGRAAAEYAAESAAADVARGRSVRVREGATGLHFAREHEHKYVPLTEEEEEKSPIDALLEMVDLRDPKDRLIDDVLEEADRRKNMSLIDQILEDQEDRDREARRQANKPAAKAQPDEPAVPAAPAPKPAAAAPPAPPPPPPAPKPAPAAPPAPPPPPPPTPPPTTTTAPPAAKKKKGAARAKKAMAPPAPVAAPASPPTAAAAPPPAAAAAPPPAAAPSPLPTAAMKSSSRSKRSNASPAYASLAPLPERGFVGLGKPFTPGEWSPEQRDRSKAAVRARRGTVADGYTLMLGENGEVHVIAKGSHAEFGAQADHDKQKGRLHLQGKRKQESEHIMARITINQLADNYDAQYEKAPTLIIPKAMANFKTMLDRHQWQEVDKYLKAGQPVPDDVRRGSTKEAAIARMLMAREATQSYHISVAAIEAAAEAQHARLTPRQQAQMAVAPPAPLDEKTRVAQFEKRGAWIAPKIDTEPPAAKKPTPPPAPHHEEDEHAPAGKKPSGLGSSVTVDGSHVGAGLSHAWDIAKIPAKYATISAHVTVSGELLVGAADAKTPVEQSVFDQIAEQIYAEEPLDDKLIEGWDFTSNALHADPLKKQAGYDVSIGVVVRLRGGHSFHGTFHLLQATRTFGKDGGSHVGVFVLSGGYDRTKAVHVQVGDALVTGSVKLGLGISIEPNMTELLKTYAPRLLASIGLDTAGEVAAEVTGGVVAIGAIGGYITVKSMLASFEDWDQMKEAAKAANAAVEGYVGGFLSAAGGPDRDGDKAYHARGAADGARLVDAIVKEQLERPQVRAAKLTAERVREMLRADTANNPDPLEKTVRANVTVMIKEQFVQQWRASRSIASMAFTKLDSMENELRTYMGLPLKVRAAAKPAAPAPIAPEDRASLEKKLEVDTTTLQMDGTYENQLLNFLEAHITDAGRANEAISKLQALHVKMGAEMKQLKALGERLGKPVNTEGLGPNLTWFKQLVAKAPKLE